LQSVWAQTASEVDLAARAARAKVEQLGVGSSSKVEVKLRDNTKLKGYIRSAEQDSFTLTDSQRGETRINYSEVVTVKKAGGGISTKTWVIIGAAAAGAIVTWVVTKPALCDGGAQSRFPC
jgi:hypothetical protein